MASFGKPDGKKGFLIGLLAGLAVALLTAPERGERLRHRIQEWLARISRSWLRTSPEPSLPGHASGGIMPDEQITLRVRRELQDRGLWLGHLDVNTVEGTVYLRGRSESSEQADAVVDAVRSVPGVRDVVDEIKRP